MQMTQLDSAQRGSTCLEITRVGFRAWMMGGGSWGFGWGPQQGVESIEAIERRARVRVDWIGTAAATLTRDDADIASIEGRK